MFRTTLRPGDMGAIVALHGQLYAEECGFDTTFEPYVAVPLAEYVLAASPRERLWVVEKEGLVKGCAAIVQADEEKAQLRWLLLHPELRGQGLGRRLLQETVAFAGEQNYRSIILWTVDILTPAARLYHSCGFLLREEKETRIWGRLLKEQLYELPLEGS